MDWVGSGSPHPGGGRWGYLWNVIPEKDLFTKQLSKLSMGSLMALGWENR
jgi:hypothetical protein